MSNIRLSKKDCKNIALAVNLLKKSSAEFNEAKKLVESAKEIIARELKSLRGIDLNTLKEGENVEVEFAAGGGINLNRKGRDNFDLETFRVGYPELMIKYTKRGVSTYFKPMD